MRTTPIFLLLAGMMVWLAGPVLASPRISEFMAENKATIADGDGDFSDWIEIYNPDAVSINLTGFALTDDPLVPQKWIFPNVSLASGARLLVFASGKNRTDPAAQLHTNFSLETTGEYLALMGPDGTTKLTEFAPYPPQEQDRSYGSAAPIVASTPILPGTACRWLVPAAAVANWNTLGFVDTAWTAGHTGVGYERNPGDALNYANLISADANTNTAMAANATCYIRVPFNVPSAANVFSLTLRMKFDDGFIAYLNGTKVAEANAPAAPVFNSLATMSHLDTDSVVFQNFDLSAQRSLLVTGTNILAIQGLNISTGSSDFLIIPQMESSAGDDSASLHTGYFPAPTPGTANGTVVDGFVHDTHFSIDRGFYTSAFPVTLTCSTPDAQIRYTTNGSAPTETTGTVYTVPINITTTTVLRAAAFKAGWQPSNVDTQTYIFAAAVVSQPSAPAGYPTTWGHTYNFGTGGLTTTTVPADYQMDSVITTAPAYSSLIQPALTSTLPVLSLSADTTAVFGVNGIYSDGRVLTPDTELPAAIEFFGPGSGTGFHLNCGLRIHGGDAPLEHPKKPFRLYFRKDYGAGKLDFPLYADSSVRKFNALQLRPGGHDGWSVPFGGTVNDLAWHATYLRDQFLRQTELDLGHLSPHGRYTHLYINGLYWGVYILHEVPANDYFMSYYGGLEEDWDVVQNPRAAESYGLVDGDGVAMDALLALCRPPTRPADPVVYQQIQDYLDIDEFIDYMLLLIWAEDHDWMGPVFRNGVDVSRFFNKNWDAGRRSRGTPTTPFYFNVWDAEIGMGTHLTAAVTGQQIVDFDFTRVGTPGTSAATTPGPPAEIYNALRSNAAFRIRFGDRLQRHFFNGGAMTQANNLTRIESLRSTLETPIVAESARWGDVNGPHFTRDDQWTPEINWLKNTFLTQRNTLVINQFKTIGLFPSVDAPIFSQFGGMAASGFQLGMTNPNAGGGTIYYTLDGTDPFIPPATGQSTLVGAGAACKYWVPTSSTLGNTWKNLADPSNIAIWSSGALGAGLRSTDDVPTPHQYDDHRNAERQFERLHSGSVHDCDPGGFERDHEPDIAGEIRRRVLHISQREHAA